MDLKFTSTGGSEYHYHKHLYDINWSETARGGPATLQATIPIDLAKPVITPGMKVNLYDDDLDELWLGRVEDIPRVTRDRTAAVVSCLGAMAYMGDERYQKIYRDATLEHWQPVDVDNRPGYTEATASSNFRMDKANRIWISPQSNQAFATDESNGFIYKPPSGVNPTKITFDWERNSDTTYAIQAYYYAGGAWTSILNNSTPASLTSGSVSSTMGGATVTHILLQGICITGNTYAQAEGAWYFKFTNIKVYGGPAALQTTVYASDVMKNLLALDASISTNYDKVTATTYDISDLKFLEKKTIAEMIAEADKSHLYNYGFKDSVSAKPRFWYYPHDLTTVHYTVSMRDCRLDLAGNSLQGQHNKVYVKYRDAQGTEVWETRTSTNTLLTALGLTRSEVVDLDTTSQTNAQTYGDAYLAAKGAVKGQLIVTGDVRDNYGRMIPPHRIKPGRNIMIRDLESEPADLTTMTSSNVLNGKNIFKITEVDVDYPRAATLQLDVPSDRLDLLLARGAFKG